MIDFDNAMRIINDGSRVIGLKDTDLTKLYNASLSKESSFDVNEAKVVPDNGINIPSEPVIEASNEVVPETSETVEETAEENTVTEPEEVEPVLEGQAPDVFSQVPPVIDSVTINSEVNNEISTPSFEVPQVEPEPVSSNQLPEMETVTNKEVEPSVALDTPQTFFDREEVSTTNVEDPALILVDNLKKLIEDKNSMINILNEKISVLENKNEILNEQLMKSEEARKLSEAQTLAAQTTLENARKEQEATGGTTPDMVSDNVKVLQPQQFQSTNGNMAA